MTDPDERADEQEALQRLRDALRDLNIPASLNRRTGVAVASGETARDVHYWQLRLMHPAAGRPTLITAPSWSGMYHWGSGVWPQKDPEGMADEVYRRYLRDVETPAEETCP